MAQMQGRLKEAVERGRQKASPEIDTYERLVDDLRERLNEKWTNGSNSARKNSFFRR